jgi:hypothetical protein
MGAAGPYISDVLASITAILREDFEGRFRPVYEDTVKMVNALPREPESEVFNAFEHFSLACKHAAEADAPSVSLQAAEATKKEAQKNLAQARRHLSIGRFFCIEHQIVYTMTALAERVARFPDDLRAAKARHQQRCNELEDQLRDAVALEIKPIEDPDKLAQAIKDFEQDSIDPLTRLLNDFLRLADEVVGPPSTLLSSATAPAVPPPQDP